MEMIAIYKNLIDLGIILGATPFLKRINWLLLSPPLFIFESIISQRAVYTHKAQKTPSPLFIFLFIKLLLFGGCNPRYIYKISRPLLFNIIQTIYINLLSGVSLQPPIFLTHDPSPSYQREGFYKKYNYQHKEKELWNF